MSTLPLLALLLVLLLGPALPGSASTECGACEQLVVNRKSARKCVRQPQCCEEQGIHLFCAVDPCFDFRRACPRARRCVAALCEQLGCRAFYYDSFYNPVPAAECRTRLLTAAQPA